MRNDLASSPATAHRARLALGWLLAGAAIMLLRYITPLRLFGPAWGATPAFWLLLAPLSVLVVLKPGAPLRLLARGLRRR